MQEIISLVPRPHQLSVACSTKKQNRAWYIYHMSDVEGIEKVERTLIECRGIIYAPTPLVA